MKTKTTPAADARTARRIVKATLARLVNANEAAVTESVQEILCELTEACESALGTLAEVIEDADTDYDIEHCS